MFQQTVKREQHFWRLFTQRHVPHKTRSGSKWCVPVWLVWLTGGTYDSGNGYGWKPNLYRRIRKQWHIHNLIRGQYGIFPQIITRLVHWRRSEPTRRCEGCCRQQQAD